MARWRVKSRILKATKGLSSPGNEIVKLVFHFSYEKKSSGKPSLHRKRVFFSKIGEKLGVHMGVHKGVQMGVQMGGPYEGFQELS